MFQILRLPALWGVCWLLSPAPLWGWWDPGHMVIALIAQDQLSPQARAQVGQLLAIPLELEAGEDPLALASVWPDLLKERGLRAFDSWHYLSTPTHPEAAPPVKASAAKPAEAPGQLLAILGQCRDTLGNPKSGSWEKAFMLRWLVHLVGDLHQPLHCVDRFDRGFPRGDLGGLRFAVSYGSITNLHFLWDSGAGLLPEFRYPDYRRSSDHAPSEALRALARKLQGQFPRGAFPQLPEANPAAWAAESAQLAKTVAYSGIRPGQVPKAAYLAKSRRVIAQQWALAGYRLGNLLNERLGSTGWTR